jgi:hypothetical protein
MTSQKRIEVIFLKHGAYAKKSYDKRLTVAKSMPPLRRTQPGEAYSSESDPVLQWLSKQPELTLFLFDKLAASDCIEYKPESKEWVGTEYDR